MKYRLVFSDFDDTLSLPDGSISERTKRAISAYRAAGGTFVICTGRSYPSIKKLLPKIYGEEKPNVPVICYQGGLTADAEGKVLRRVPMERRGIIALAEELEKRRIICQTYSGEHMFCSRMTNEARQYSVITDCEYEIVGDLTAYMRGYGGDFDKLLMIETPERIRELYEEFTARAGDYPDFKFVFSRPIYLEAIPKNSGKDSALKFLADRLGVHISDTAAFGDSNNDVDMLKAAGLGVAIGNAREECKRVADVVAPPNTEDGVAQMLESFISG